MENTTILNQGRAFDEHDRATLIEYTDFDEDDIKYMFALPGARTTIDIHDFNEEAVLLYIEWYDADGEELGRAVREFKHYDGICYNHSLKLEGEWQNKSLAASLYARQKARMTEWSYDSIRLEANITIGRYAWAKEGFKYSNPGEASQARTNLKHWLGQNGMRDLAKQYADKIAHLADPYDFATFDIPGVTMRGGQINNAAVGPDYVMHLGKAFMLDRGGHGSWNGRYDL